tara:strand:+ start:5207 stop:5416 length:210 start_codon:yes stop_codon:yes gene_type:complete
MAIEKANAVVEGIEVLADGSLQATVNYALVDGGTTLTRVREDIAVSNATSAENNAVARVRDKAAILAVS